MKRTSPPVTDVEKIRLDKWLWAARFFKTRELAIKAIKQGKAIYEGQKPNPSKEVHIGATLTVTQGLEQKTVIVKALSAQRQSASIAQTLYEETPESIAYRQNNSLKREDQKFLRITAPRAPKRPEKQARRKMRQLRRQDEEDQEP